jgi:hypothetical protein
MSEQERNRELSRQWFEQVWNQRRPEAIERLFAADGIAYGLDPQTAPPGRGPVSFIPFWTRFCGAFPDLRVAVEDVLAEGDKTAIRFSFRGTHLGNQLGSAPTGKTIAATGIAIIRWRNGQIVEGWNEFDALGLMKQAGAI